VTDRETAGRSGVTSNMRSVWLVGCCLILIAVAGCGVYTLNPKGKSSIKTIGIDPFENTTGEYAFADRLSEILTEAFIREGSLKVVPSSSADAVLVGVLTRYERVPFKFTSSDQVEQYKLKLEFDISLKNPREQTDIWKEHMSQEGIYTVATESEQDGQTRATEQLVQAVLNKTTRSW
jgi:hypothetical protein